MVQLFVITFKMLIIQPRAFKRRLLWWLCCSTLIYLLHNNCIPINGQQVTASNRTGSTRADGTNDGAPTPATIKESAAATTATTTTGAPESLNSSDITLLSGEEFVDAKEAPTILFDGLSNEPELSNSKKNETTTTTTTTTITNGPELKPDRTSQAPSINSSDDLVAKHRNGQPNEVANTTTTTTTKLVENENAHELGESDGGMGGDGSDDEEEDSIKETSSPQPFEPPQNVSQYMDYIEKLFKDLKHQITDLFEPHIPQLIRTSQLVELSNSCSYDMLRMALALRQFEPWALRMIDSSGKVPEGIFEGSFTALGSYDECLNTVFQSTPSHMTSSASQPQSSSSGASHNQAHQATSSGDKPAPPTQGKYCLVTLSPFMPPKPPADKVERMFQDEANRRNYTREDQFSRLSPMFYYMKFRIGVCIPSTCDQGDMDSISEALSSSLRLNITIPDCRVKQAHVPLTKAQFMGGIVFATVLAIILAATISDYFKMKWQEIKIQEMRLRNQVVASGQYALKQQADVQTRSADKSKQFKININHRSQLEHEPTSRSKFEQRLGKHWSWMSFSLMTNFRLYFRNTNRTNDCGNQRPPEVDHKSQTGPGNQQALNDHISCLNGIRVLSLCWVIIANSYLTLDPRATKMLTKTREAPRDFFFQLVVQASLAIETFFFLSGLLMSLSFARRLKPTNQDGKEPVRAGLTTLTSWIQFYVHRYVRMTPPTMLVIAFSMYAYHFGDGPLWFEATRHVHQSCSQNWWRHMLHIANFIDTRQMCFIHYWYIAADMQLFLFAPLVMFLLYKCRHLGYAVIALLGSASIGIVFYVTYSRNLPPTLLFYNTDPESRREFGNTIMTKPFAHILPYLVGMLVGWCLLNSKAKQSSDKHAVERATIRTNTSIEIDGGQQISLTGIGGFIVTCIALTELFLPYQWNNSRLPGRMISSIYAAVFRLGWSLVLAYIVITCRHLRNHKCTEKQRHSTSDSSKLENASHRQEYCFCSSGGNLTNRLLSLEIFAHLSKLSFVAYLIHLPLMSVFIGQTRGLFAFSHTLVIHLAISYLVMTFILSFVLVHIIEFPFLTFERLLFDRFRKAGKRHSVVTTSRSETRATGGIDLALPTLIGGDDARNFQKLKTIPTNNEMTSFKAHGPSLTSHDCYATAASTLGNQSHQSYQRRPATRPEPGDISERL